MRASVYTARGKRAFSSIYQAEAARTAAQVVQSSVGYRCYVGQRRVVKVYPPRFTYTPKILFLCTSHDLTLLKGILLQ